MGDGEFPNSGQRWRSLIDGDMVVTGEKCGDQIVVWFERFRIAIAVNTGQFVEDYEFVESSPMPSEGREWTEAQTRS